MFLLKTSCLICQESSRLKKECSNFHTRLKNDLSVLTLVLSFIYNHKADILSIALSLELSGGDRLMLSYPQRVGEHVQ